MVIISGSMDRSSVAPMTIDSGHDHQEHSDKKLSPNSTTGRIKPPKGGWNAALVIIFVEVADRFAFYGLSGNLIMYLTNVLHQPTVTAVKNVNMWIGVSSLFPLLGALVADSYLGRFKTILLSSIIYLVGMVLLCFSVSVIPVGYRKAVFFLSLYVLSVGEGGHKPCVQTFAADQFDEDTPAEKEAKSSFFNWWYLGIVAGAAAAIFVVIYIQDNVSWTVGFGMQAGVIGAALVLFLLGTKWYRQQVPVGSPLTAVAQVLVAAARKWREKSTGNNLGVYYGDDRILLGPLVEGHSAARNLTLMNKFRLLDKAALIDNHDASSGTRNPWRLCSIYQVNEVKLVVRLIPIWLSCLMFNVVQAQLHTFFTKQGSTLIRSIGPHFQLPPSSLQGVVGITILSTVMIYDRVFVPMARKLTRHHSGITILQRIGSGLFLSILNMVVSAIVEAKRVNIAAEHNLLDSPKAVLPMRIWWLFPQYMICGLSDTFTVVGLQELFYAEMPESMRSLGAAAHISILGVGSFISNWIISLVQLISSRSGQRWLGDNLNRSHLDYFYWVLAGLSALNLCVYIWVAKGFVYKENEDRETTKVKDAGSKYMNGEV